MIKLLRVIRSLNPYGGGPAEGIKQSAPFLEDCGISTTVVSLDRPGSSFLEDLSFKHIPVWPAFGGYGYSLELVSLLSCLCREYDIAIVEGIWQYHSFAAWRAFTPRSFPYVVFVHGMLDPWFKRTYPIKHFKKSLYWPLADYKVLRDARAVLYTTTTEMYASRRSFRLYSAHEQVVGYGAIAPSPPLCSATALTTFYQTFPALLDKEIFLFFGRLHPKKGVDLLIKAFSTLPNKNGSLHLVLAGPVNTRYYRYLSHVIAVLRQEQNITFTGYLATDLKWSAFATAQVFCLPSHHENFGVSVAEAMSMGLPLVISNSINIYESVLSAGAGIVHSDTLTSTIEALREWTNLSSTQRRYMSENSQKLFFQHYNWASASVRLNSLLRSYL